MNTLSKNTSGEYLKSFASRQLHDIILPFWINNTVDTQHDGFFGRIDSTNQPDDKADKGLVLNARILWTFAKAATEYNTPEYSYIANRAYRYLRDKFYDRQNKGFYWSLNHKGEPSESKKQVYGQAFAVYALSEYYGLTYLEESRNLAVETYNIIMKHTYDKNYHGYFEAFTRDWKLIEDMRLSDKDSNEKKTMNTHLHLLEAYTNLYRVFSDNRLKEAIIGLLEIFANKIINQADWHFDLFFNEHWERKSNKISYGHDIEGSWLLAEAAHIVKDNDAIEKFNILAIKMAEACIPGINKAGWLIQDIERGKPAHPDETEWWMQAEAVIGFINAWQISANPEFLDIAKDIALFIDKNLADKKQGEWFNKTRADGAPITGLDKAGFWKCPYHNARMCFEILHRIS